MSTDSTCVVATVILYMDVSSQLHTPAAFTPRLSSSAIHGEEGCVCRVVPRGGLHSLNKNIFTGYGAHLLPRLIMSGAGLDAESDKRRHVSYICLYQ